MRGQFPSYLAKPQRPFSRGNRQSLVIVMLFCLFWGWGKISCNWVWGPETACSHDVGATICHYTICLYCFLQTGSPKNQRRTWQGRVSSDRLIEEDWWDCCWQTQDGVVVSDSWDFSLPLFFFSEEGASTLGRPSSQDSAWETYPTRNTVILVLPLPLVFLPKHKRPCVPKLKQHFGLCSKISITSPPCLPVVTAGVVGLHIAAWSSGKALLWKLGLLHKNPFWLHSTASLS